MKTGYIMGFALFLAGLIFTVFGAVLLSKHNALDWNTPTLMLGLISTFIFANALMCVLAEHFLDDRSEDYPLYRKL